MNNRFTVEQKELLALLASMQPICGKRTTLDITSYIMFQIGYNELVLRSTDLEISLEASCSILETDGAPQQSFLVPGKRIFDLVKEIEGDILFSFDGKQLHLKATTINVSLHVKDAQEFPPFPERIENFMQIKSSFLLDLLSKVAFLIPQNNANVALNGLFLEVDSSGLTMTTTDGHCLAQAQSSDYRLDQPKKWLLPRRAVFEIKKILEADDKKGARDGELFLGLCGNQIAISGSSFNFFSRLLAVEFPEYRSVLEKKGFAPATIDRHQFLKSLRRSACLLSGQFIATDFNFSDDILQVSMKNSDVGRLEERLPIGLFKGESIQVKFYAPYLLNGLQSFADNTVQFYLKNAASPIIFQSEQSGCLVTYLVMPVSGSYQP